MILLAEPVAVLRRLLPADVDHRLPVTVEAVLLRLAGVVRRVEAAVFGVADLVQGQVEEPGQVDLVQGLVGAPAGFAP